VYVQDVAALLLAKELLKRKAKLVNVVCKIGKVRLAQELLVQDLPILCTHYGLVLPLYRI
jgi:hypothetical protein